MIAAIIYFTALALIFYTWIGYPVLAWLLSLALGRPVRKAAITPRVSIIIAAYNEERDLAARLDNTLALDYPPEQLEIIVASDCSTDRTDLIARSYAGRGVRLHRQPHRRGKTVAQHQAVSLSSGAILVFSDATTLYDKSALRHLVSNFADPEVGCVAGQLIYASRAASSTGRGCRSYWGYEKMLRRSESRLGSLIGVSGCLYAVRRSSYTRLSREMIDDFVIATEIHQQRLRTVFEPQAVAFEEPNKRTRNEFSMRVRIIEQTLRALAGYREALHWRRGALFAWQMFSHKRLRYLVPFCLVALFAASLWLVNDGWFYQLALLGQCGFYLLALAGWLCERAGIKAGVLALPAYFVLANVASLAAYLKYFRGEAFVIWQPLRESRLPQTEQS